MSIRPPAVHYTVLDTYRFFGALGVLAAHFLTNYWGGPDQIHVSLQKLGLLIDFFTILSGIVMAHNYAGRMATPRDYGVFLQRRLARLYPLHLLTALLFAVMALAALGLGFQVTNHAQLDFRYLPANLLLVHAWGTAPIWTFNGPSWTLSAELLPYLLLPLFLYAARRLGPFGLLATMIVYTRAMEMVRRACGLSHWMEATYDYGNFRAVAGFGFGIAIERFLATRAAPLRLPFWPGHLAALLVAALMLLRVESNLIIAAILVAAALLAAADRAGSPSLLASPRLAICRDSAFGLYLWHIPLSVILVTLPMRLLHIGEGWRGPLLLLCAVASLAVAYASFRVFENPARRWLSALAPFSRARPRPAIVPAE